jgi:hypothetical protein
MKQFREFRMLPMTMGRDNTIVGARAPELDEVKTILQKDIKGLSKISDIEIRFSDEKEWKRMSALVKKELMKPAYKGIRAKDVYFSPDPLQIGFGDPNGKLGINIKPIVDLVVKQTKDPQTRIKSLAEEKNTIDEAPLKIAKHKGVEVIANRIEEAMRKDDGLIKAVVQLLKQKVELAGKTMVLYNR